MLQPWFLDIDHTMRLHRNLIEAYGGSEGIRESVSTVVTPSHGQHMNIIGYITPLTPPMARTSWIGC
ncbi:MAG: hypothetical protein RLZZ436_1047 [Planctomycetota bacterium]|jgi:hypothetical protein